MGVLSSIQGSALHVSSPHRQKHRQRAATVRLNPSQPDLNLRILLETTRVNPQLPELTPLTVKNKNLNTVLAWVGAWMGPRRRLALTLRMQVVDTQVLLVRLVVLTRVVVG